MCLLVTCVSSLEKYLFMSFIYLKLVCCYCRVTIFVYYGMKKEERKNSEKPLLLFAKLCWSTSVIHL